MSQNITRVGIDLAKNIFQVCAVNHRGKVLFNKTLKRHQLASFVANLPACEVILESCASSNYWARVFGGQGHTVKLINPAYVRPYVKTNKNDAADAEALCEAASRPTMRFVQPKSLEQQDIQLLHRVRERLVSQRTSLSNQVRGLLAEYGIVIPQGLRNVRNQLPSILEEVENGLSAMAREAFAQLYEEFVALDEHIKILTKRVKLVSESNERCTQLMSVPGIGPMVATAVFTAMGSPSHYRNGREFAAFLGLVPRQYSTGGKTTLKGISKRGDKHTRTLLVLGAQAALLRMPKQTDPLSRWACRLKERKGHNVAIVALANKLARISWAIAANNTEYKVRAA